MTGEPGRATGADAPEEPPAEGLPVTWDLWRRRVYLWSLTCVIPAALLTWALWGQRAALSVVLGGGLGLVNLQLLGGAVFRMLGSVAADPNPSTAPASPAAAPFRWVATALATAVILWYMAGQPEGLAAGFSLALMGFIAAAAQTSAELSSKSGPSRDQD